MTEQTSQIRLIALDMDGTLLNSGKKVSQENRKALREAVSRGVTLVYATGRAVCELEEYFLMLPEIRYAVFASGTGLYDSWERKAFCLHPMPVDQVRAVLKAAEGRDIMPQIVLADRDAVQSSHLEDLERFQMGVYRPMYERAMTRVKDILAFGKEHEKEILKINLYHTSPEERMMTFRQLESVRMEKVFSETTSLECAIAGINKGSGLKTLCGQLGIDPSACMAVGDANNDIPMFRVAGISVAMGNADASVKAEADRTVADNDHDGCAEAIRLAIEG